MSWVMPEIVVQNIIQKGFKELREDKAAFLDLFDQFTQDELDPNYGAAYLEKIWTWFYSTKIPCVQAWSFNVTKVPSISIRLGSEVEDESKAALDDVAVDDEDGETLTGVFTVQVDIGVHAAKSGDHVLWLYYIVSYILFKYKRMAERLGLKLGTFSATDYNREPTEMGDNIWTRWIRLKVTTQNFLAGITSEEEIAEVNTATASGLDPATDVAASLDVDFENIDITANNGLIVSEIDDPEGFNDVVWDDEDEDSI